MSLDQLKSLGVKSITRDGNNFDNFVSLLDTFTVDNQTQTKTLADLKNDAKVKGDLFELFCQRYLMVVWGCDQVYLWRDVPETIRTQLGLTNFQDMGIDLVACRNDRYYPVQCKYRKYSEDPRRQVVSWRDISTYYALVARTGPWDRHLIMTTAQGVKRAGGRTEKDHTIARGTFQKIDQGSWYQIFDIQGQTTKDNQVDHTAMLEARLKRFAL